MKWRITRIPGAQHLPWQATGWVWSDDHGEWMPYLSIHPTQQAALAHALSFRASFWNRVLGDLSPWEAPC